MNGEDPKISQKKQKKEYEKSNHLFSESKIVRLIKFTNKKNRNKRDEVNFTYYPICHSGEYQNQTTRLEHENQKSKALEPPKNKPK